MVSYHQAQENVATRLQRLQLCWPLRAFQGEEGHDVEETPFWRDQGGSNHRAGKLWSIYRGICYIEDQVSQYLPVLSAKYQFGNF